MELISNIIIEYLKHNKRIVVPKLGAFIVKPSSKNIIFSDLMRNDDGVLRSMLMAYGVQELVANGMIDRFVFEIRHAVSNNEIFTIEHLGEFRAGANNTIQFTYKYEPQVFGGNIKPPVEVIEQKIRPRREVKPRSPHTPTNTPHRASRNTGDGGDGGNITMGKPDAYLRGLKYDNTKNKKRGEEGMRSNQRGGSRGVILIIIILLMAAGAGVYFWLYDTPKPKQRVITEIQIEERDTTATTIADSLILDSTLVVSPDMAATTNN